MEKPWVKTPVCPKVEGNPFALLLKKTSSSKSHLSYAFIVNDVDDRMEQVNINTASEEELMTLPGINREIARSIVEHRKAIGRFRKVEDLALVRGIGADKLELIRPEICVTFRRGQSCSSSRAPSYDSLKSADSRLTIKSNKIINVNKASVFDLQSVHGITQEIAAAILHYRNKKGPFRQIEDLLKVKNMDRMRLDNISRFLTVENAETDASEKLLSTYSPRPVLQEDFKYCRNGEPVFRVASWNLHEFSLEKANNLGVKEVICRSILENGWSIIAVQDVMNVMALRSICEELNRPKLLRVKEWKDKDHNWNFCMLDVRDSKLGFIYDSGGVVDIELVSLNEAPGETQNDYGFLSLGDLEAVFPPTTITNFVYPKVQIPPHHTSNVLHNKKTQQQLTGAKDVVRQGLTHLAIPNGWNWGGPVSPYCPIWIEIFLNCSPCTAL
ncbi:hypothetical protein NQ317_017685 [Molorchus minor]|uniref:Endonuclease/exonuclease/phosphatase family domain-containing protein 1 n=1 Tax=Molorchus minor TaxID=1323400 RepID=A0ABQ9JQ80_9CUCU|nr:hypothetical protein NQ317_017685 [Molorchus minor]